MSAKFQFDLHPDAELLNGFVENDLPAGERTQILDHLASCERCREVVFLSQSAAVTALATVNEPRELAAAAPRMPEMRRKPRFNLWHFAWAGAAALACMIAVAVTVQVRRNAAHEQLARAVPNPAPVSAMNAPLAAAAKTQPVDPNTAIQSAGRSAAVVKPGFQLDKSRVNGTISTPKQVAPPPPKPLAMDSLSNASADETRVEVDARAMSSKGLAGVGANRVGGPAVSQQSQAQKYAATPRMEPPAASVPAAGASSSASLGDAVPQSSNETVTVQADSLRMQPQTVHGALYAPVAPRASAGLAEAKKPGLTMLPGGLPLVSTAAAGRTTLAIDAVGALFLSSDLGKTWEPVEATWKGKATKVRLAQPAQGAFGVGGHLFKGAKEKSANGVSTLNVLFEIVNDKNDVWISADGKTWSAK